MCTFLGNLSNIQLSFCLWQISQTTIAKNILFWLVNSESGLTFSKNAQVFFEIGEIFQQNQHNGCHRKE